MITLVVRDYCDKCGNIWKPRNAENLKETDITVCPKCHTPNTDRQHLKKRD